MKIMTKKTFVTLAAVLLLLTMVVAGTVAYLTDATESLVNTFNATYVDVTVTDQVENNVKSNVTITNTGETSAYIRARIVGSWVSDEDNMVVQAWNPTADGIFVGLPGENWVQKDGYYYYKLPVEPGETTGSPLFTSYTVEETVEGAHLELDILVQAIQSEGGAVEDAWEVDPSQL